MAKPKIFVSSTYYDLKHIRDNLERFIISLGYEPILFERGSIPFDPDEPLDESCYKEAKECDIFVLIIGGRYGSPDNIDREKIEKGKIDKGVEEYNSITKKEFQAAHEAGIPIYILVDKNVVSEHKTFLVNKELDNIKYAFVDTKNVFLLLDYIHSHHTNNLIHEFSSFSDIELWLKEQWSGLFGQLLKQKREKKVLVTLSDRIAEISEVNETLKTYIEKLLHSSDIENVDEFIEKEMNRIRFEKFRRSELIKFIADISENELEDIYNLFLENKTWDSFIHSVIDLGGFEQGKVEILFDLINHPNAQRDWNELIKEMNLEDHIMIIEPEIERINIKFRKYDEDGDEICRICEKKMGKTNEEKEAHLNAMHGLTLRDYTKRFPKHPVRAA